MFNGKKVVVVMPAYNAELTLRKTYDEVTAQGIVDHVIVVDDASHDDTACIARSLPHTTVHIHASNLGYGANQKTCYRLALEHGADVIIMVHPDYQYTPKLIPAMASMIGNNLYHCVLGSRILGGYARRGGMPWWKYVSNRCLTLAENILTGAKLSEYHTGYRAFSHELLEKLPLESNSDDFVFDNQMLAQILWAGFTIAEVSCPTKYFPEASSINFVRSSKIRLRLSLDGLCISSGQNESCQVKIISEVMAKSSQNYRPFWIYLILTIAALAVYWQVHSFEFTNYDDDEYVYKNKHIITGFSRENIIWVFTSQHVGNWHPLTGLSHLLDSQLFDSNAGLHHLTNLFFHTINTLLLFTVLRQITLTTLKSAFIAALFALHPLHVESVAWISERKDVLSTFFWILTIAAYFRYINNPCPRRYLFTLLLFILGLMSKPMVVTLPFALLLLDYWPFERLDRKSLPRLILEKTPFFAFAAASGIITFFVQRSAGAVRKIEAIPLGSRIENALVSYATYIGKMIWPSHLAVFYPHPENKPQMWPAIIAAAILIVITVCVILLAKRRKYLPVGWFWYIGTLVPVIGLVQVGDQAMADRYTYIPLIGLFIIIVWGADDLLKEWQYRKIILQMSAPAILIVFSICTWFQTSYWHSSITLFEHALKVTKDNYVAHYYLTWPLAEQGKLDQAIEQFKETLKIKPDEPFVHNNMAMALTQQGNITDALVHFKEALHLDPDFAEAHSGLGYVFNCQGKFEDANKQFMEALRLKTGTASTHSNFAYTLTRLGKYDEAVSHLQSVVQLEPNSAPNYYHLASALVSAGRIDEAVTNFRKTLSIAPNQSEPMSELAWILATHKESKFYNPHEAIQLAERACKLVKSPNAAMLDNLAATYASAGKFAQAVFTAEEALRLAESSGQLDKTQEIRNRLSLYKESRPYVEPEHK